MRQMLKQSYKKDDDLSETSLSSLIAREIVGTFVSRRTRRPTIVGYVVIACAACFALYYFMKGGVGKEDEREYLINPKFRVHDMLPKAPDVDPQIREFEEVKEKNLKGGAGFEVPVYDPNLHKAPEEVIQQRERDIYGMPNPKEYPVDVLQQPVEDLCAGEMDVLVIVETAAQHIMARNGIRLSWGLQDEDDVKENGQKWATVFVTGVAHEKFEINVTNEAHVNQDILQGDFLDSPHESTRKFMLAMDWVVNVLESNCRPKYIIKTVDNIYQNMPAILHWLRKTISQSKDIPQDAYVGKLLRQDIVIRDPEDFNYVSPEDFPDKVFPNMINGPLYLFSYSAYKKLYEAKAGVTPIAVEDGYIGLLAKKAGLVPKNDRNFMLSRLPSNANDCHYLNLLFEYDVHATGHTRIYNRVQRAKASGKCKGRNIG